MLVEASCGGKPAGGPLLVVDIVHLPLGGVGPLPALGKHVVHPGLLERRGLLLRGGHQMGVGVEGDTHVRLRLEGVRIASPLRVT